jgi:phenylpropionate dioxygenase-like ring-hydroxylating dioxygenase large terminal subunit
MSPADELAAFDATLPLEKACTIPSAWYFDPKIAALENERVFGDTWQLVGRLDQVARPGDFLTADVAGEPIVVVRGEDGVLRGFFNVCRHRAARVAIEPCGHATKLRCRYHGWTYDLAGRLRGVPEFDGVADFRREDNGLSPVATETWGPLVFVHFKQSGTDRRSVVQYLSPLPQRCQSLGIERLKFFERREYVLNCNWKVFCDNYLDGGYHVNTIHPGLAGVLDYSGYRTELADLCSVQISPMQKPSTPSSTPPDKGGPSGVAAVRQGDNAYYWWIFPNLMINLYQGVMDTNLVLPLGAERCRVIFDFYFENVAGDEAARFNTQSVAVGHQIQQEDVDICEDVQRGLASRAFDTGRFSVRREAGVYHFHRLLAERLRAGS